MTFSKTLRGFVKTFLTWLVFLIVNVASFYLVHVCAGVLVELVAGGEDDECDLAVAEHGQLVRFLHHAELPLVEGHLRGKGEQVIFCILVT
jgi:hypothetical protein